MYVEEVCIDGFKSYAQRTVVPAFDPLFNAITGLNGSGKSNILDAICFVLGITNLSQARATTSAPRKRHRDVSLLFPSPNSRFPQTAQTLDVSFFFFFLHFVRAADEKTKPLFARAPSAFLRLLRFRAEKSVQTSSPTRM